MKAIIITTELKQLNPDIFGTGIIGTIKEFNKIPNSFYSLVYNVGQRSDGYNTPSMSEFWKQDGFYDIIKPIDGIDYDSSIQKLGPLYFNVTNFTYPIIGLTQLEIDDNVEIEGDLLADEIESNRQIDGENEVKVIFRHLRKLLNNGTLTNNQFKAAQDLLFDALLPMTYGLWDVTKIRLDNIPNPSNQTMLNILEDIRTRINDYILA